MSIFIFIPICGLLFGGILYLLREYRRLNLHISLITQRNVQDHFVLTHSPILYVYWFQNQDTLHFSSDLRAKLDLDLEHTYTHETLLGLFGASSFSPFQKSLEHLVDFGGEFQLTLQMETLKSHFYVSGRRLLQSDVPSQPFIYFIHFVDLDPIIQIKALDALSVQEKSLNNLQMLCDLSPLALWMRDAHGRIDYCNRSYAGALETSVYRAISENKELLPGVGPKTTYGLFKESTLRMEKNVMRTHIVVAGHRRFLEVAEIPLAENGRSIGYAIDMSEVEDIARDMQQAEDAHHQLLDHLSTAIAIYGHDHKLRYFNQTYRKIFDLDENWLYKKPTLFEILDRLRETRKITEYADFQAHKKSRVELFNNIFQPIHEMLSLPDGRVFRMVIAPHLEGGLIYLFDDITDKLSLERGYKTLMAVQRETLDHLFEGVAVFGSDNRLRLSNPALASIWKLSEMDLAPSTHINDLFLKISPLFQQNDERDVLKNRVVELLNQRHPAQGIFQLKPDTTIHYSYLPLPDGSHMLSFLDVSDQKRHERALKKRTKNLEETEQLKNDFLSHVSYELRAPLNSISGFAEILTHEYFGALNEKQKDYCQGISNSCEKLMNLMNDMIDLASIDAGTLNLNHQGVSLHAFFESLIALVENRACDQGLDLCIEDHTHIEHMCVDPKRLKHALFNILANSIKFTPSGGRIVLKLEEDLKRSDYLIIRICDTGVGMSFDEQERIFQLFSHGDNTLPNTHKGAGLGLSLARGLIYLHGGHIEIESDAGQGTTVSCFIPVKPLALPVAFSIDPKKADVHAEL